MEFNFNNIKQTQTTQQEESQTLIPINNEDDDDGNGYYYGTGVTTVKVVEYMLSSMSSELLRKFPDNSAFDFDYTQSAIWSPLVPHPSKPSSPVRPLKQGKLSFDEEETETDAGNVNDAKFDSCMFNCFRIGNEFGGNKIVGVKKRGMRNRGFGQLGVNCLNSGNVSVDSGCSSPIRVKGWKKVLKAASKQFKKTMKKKDSGVHLKLSSNGFSKVSY
ncbi:hypothetical protein HanPI659440_Chr02g0037421 [Helianthus annuus]|nr:hypothetical protein HanPI659440_Chr02g0037421 [Helianthus annuus]